MMWVRSLSWEDPPEESMATHSSVLAWRIPGTGEPGGLPSPGRTESDTTGVTQQSKAKSKGVENVCLIENLYRDIYRSIIHNYQNLEATKIAFSK